jgi:predicted nucleic acid-binding protein
MGELLAGMEIMPAGKKNTLLAEALHHMLTNMFPGRILPFEENAARAFGSIIKKARVNGTGIGLADAQIAAIALANGYSVATRDVPPFRASGVHVINPWLS